MNIFKKVFKTKKTSADVGHELYDQCIFFTKKHLPLYQELRNELGIVLDEDESIVEVSELLIVNMWSITKSISGGKYDEVSQHMHDHYFSGHLEENRQDAQDILLARYEQYESLFDHEKGQHLQLALYILANMYNDGKLDKRFLNPFIGIRIIKYFNEVMIMAMNFVYQYKIV